MKTRRERFIESKEYEAVSPVDCEFRVGEKVMFTNDRGVTFGPHTVIGFATPENMVGNRFVYLDYDCAWFPCSPDSITKAI